MSATELTTQTTKTVAPQPHKRFGGSHAYSGVYLLVALVLFFSWRLPGLFFTEVTVRTELSSVAITGILAIGVLVPMAAGMFDLSFASVAGLSIMLTVWLSQETNYPEAVLALCAISAAVLCGLVNAYLIAVLQLESLVVTLGTSSVVLGVTEFVTKGAQLYGRFTPGFLEFGRDGFGPVPYLIVLLAVLALLAWVWLEQTPSGRYALAVGSNPVASRLAGIDVRRVRFMTLVVSAAVAGLAGVCLAAQVGIGSTVTGPGYLLPTIAAVFFGATQVQTRVNVVGTVLALLVIGTGIKGLQLSGAEAWVTHFFNGSVLLAAVSTTT